MVPRFRLRVLFQAATFSLDHCRFRISLWKRENFCIRATSPIFYFGTALLGYATARELYDDRVAFWAAIAIVSAPGVAFSARIASTDVPLLFFWTLALLAYVHILRGGGLRWTVTLGFALGLGLLAKYAMIYFVIGAAIVSVIDHTPENCWDTEIYG